MDYERDPLDAAANLTMAWTQAAIQNASTINGIHVDGMCSWCDEACDPGAHFHPGCSEDYQKEQDRQKREGKNGRGFD